MNEIIVNDVKITYRTSDNYINITKLCQAGNREFRTYHRSKKTKTFLKILSKELKIDNLIKIEQTNSKDKATWAHPRVATNIAQWISCEFDVKITQWIEEWKKFGDNDNIYIKEINNIIPENLYSTLEKEIQLRLQKELGGEIEVKTDAGYIDLLTDNEIIEIKHITNWKNAVGQILIYSQDYPTHIKRIHLFDDINIKPDKIIEERCEKFNIKITYEI